MITWLLNHPTLLTSHIGIAMIGFFARHYLFPKLGLKGDTQMDKALAVLNVILALIPTVEKLEPEVVQAFKDVEAAVVSAIASIKNATNNTPSTPAA
jgi:hypothetical protein